MPTLPKRKSSEMSTDSHTNIKRKAPRLTPNTSTSSASTPSSTTSTPIPVPIPIPTSAPDSLINPTAALAYWSSTAPTISGVLGGYPQVSRVDLQGSANFLTKLRRQSPHFPPEKKLRRVVDCGAGIGRITDGLLRGLAERVDIVEPVRAFTEQIAAGNVGRVWNLGLEEWDPREEGGKAEGYALVFIQWCVGQLTDRQLVELLRRLPPALSTGGWIVVKENLSQDVGGDIFDETDSSVTRTDGKFRKLFEEAGLKIVSTELQRGMPKGLYPVRTYALQPR